MISESALHLPSKPPNLTSAWRQALARLRAPGRGGVDWAPQSPHLRSRRAGALRGGRRIEGAAPWTPLAWARRVVFAATRPRG